MASMSVVEEQNEALKRELAELSDKLTAQQSSGQHQYDEISQLKAKIVTLQKTVDTEMAKKEQVEAQNIILGLQLKDSHDTGIGKNKLKKQVKRPDEEGRPEAAKAATKIIRTVDQWLRQRDLEQALLRGSAISDIGFSTLAQVLIDCPSLHTLDLSKNQLTMDSCSDICQIVTTAPTISYISLEANLFSLRSIGYFMTAIMERQNNNSVTPLAILHMQDNDGIIQAIEADIQPTSADLKAWPKLASLPSPAPAILLALSKALWKFLHDTGHPQVKSTKVEQVRWNRMDPHTIKKMQSALSKILLISEDDVSDKKKPATLTADQAIYLPSDDVPMEKDDTKKKDEKSSEAGKDSGDEGTGRADSKPTGGAASSTSKMDLGSKSKTSDHLGSKSSTHNKAIVATGRRDKCNTFNLKQILTKNGTILMNMLERMLDSTAIDARDIETERTLLEHACHTGNLALAKLCYRRGANLNGKSLSGDIPFTIATKNKRYDIMEFLHLYGVSVNSADNNGCTAMHVATANNDVDAVCRLVEWGADVNLQDRIGRTALHFAAIGGHSEVCMLLLELAADLNARDAKEYTAVAHAENNDHFQLMDRLVALGGKGHGLQKDAAGDNSKPLGFTSVTAGELKASALGRLAKWKLDYKDN
ncbi:unnamed protein product [Amoebophrya sp. A25]|nr:unnamed protein product [Amoebophrya sp. A25]|eukprot:GSA25T00016950001.1